MKGQWRRMELKHHDGWEKIDRYVRPVLDVLNSLPSVETYASCNGHGEPKEAYIALLVGNWDSLLTIEKAIHNLRSAMREDFEEKSEAWVLQFDCFASDASKDKIRLSIRYENFGCDGNNECDGIKLKQWMHTKKAWGILHKTLLEQSKKD